MKKIIAASLLILLSTSANAKRLHKERYYQKKNCTGVVEYRLPDRTRVDCLTDEYAEEFDFYSKTAESIGQSLHYARMTGKKASIALIVEKESQMKYYHRLMDNIKFYKLPITVRIIRP